MCVFVCVCVYSDHNSHTYIAETWSSTASGADPYPEIPHSSDPQLDLSALVSLETDSGGEEGREETIVYLWISTRYQTVKGQPSTWRKTFMKQQSRDWIRTLHTVIYLLKKQKRKSFVFFVFYCAVVSYWKHRKRSGDNESEIVTDSVLRVSCTLARGTRGMFSVSLFCFLSFFV